MADLEGFEETASAQLPRSSSATASSSRRSTRSAASTIASSRSIVGAPARRRRRSRRSRLPRRSTALITLLRDRRSTAIARRSTSPGCRTAIPTVDTMNGFIEVYMDARGMKGAWEGVVYYANHEKTEKIRALADARAVVRGSPAGRSEVSQAEGAGRVGAGDRGGGRSRRLGSDHADRRQPAERSAHPREVRQQVGVAVERARRLRALACPTASARSSAWDDAEVGARQAVGRVCRAS